jgi:hypothetical protein
MIKRRGEMVGIYEVQSITDRFIKQVCFEESIHLSDRTPSSNESLVDCIAMGSP